MIAIEQCYNCQQYEHFMKTCQHETKCGHCAGEHFFGKCHMTSSDRKTKCVLCDGEHEAWSSICEYRKKEKSRIDAKNAKVPKLYKVNKNASMTNCETNGDLPTKWKLVTSEKRRRSVDRPASNSASESTPKGAKSMALYYERRFPEAPVRRVGRPTKRLASSQTALVATQNSVSDSLADSTLDAVIQIAATQSSELEL